MPCHSVIIYSTAKLKCQVCIDDEWLSGCSLHVGQAQIHPVYIHNNNCSPLLPCPKMCFSGRLTTELECEGLTFTALKYFFINHGDQRDFPI